MPFRCCSYLLDAQHSINIINIFVLNITNTHTHALVHSPSHSTPSHLRTLLPRRIRSSTHQLHAYIYVFSFPRRKLNYNPCFLFGFISIFIVERLNCILRQSANALFRLRYKSFRFRTGGFLLHANIVQHIPLNASRICSFHSLCIFSKEIIFMCHFTSLFHHNHFICVYTAWLLFFSFNLFLIISCVTLSISFSLHSYFACSKTLTPHHSHS